MPTIVIERGHDGPWRPHHHDRNAHATTRFKKTHKVYRLHRSPWRAANWIVSDSAPAPASLKCGSGPNRELRVVSHTGEGRLPVVPVGEDSLLVCR